MMPLGKCEIPRGPFVEKVASFMMALCPCPAHHIRKGPCLFAYWFFEIRTSSLVETVRDGPKRWNDSLRSKESRCVHRVVLDCCIFTLLFSGPPPYSRDQADSASWTILLLSLCHKENEANDDIPCERHHGVALLLYLGPVSTRPRTAWKSQAPSIRKSQLMCAYYQGYSLTQHFLYTRWSSGHQGPCEPSRVPQTTHG